eukprot:TRINITY_DN66936_c8_g15_i1.p1 TRINITY_DN66936_c8_g15~~TRINITY_DN66936_c8_g15_i1.p1  ORF type:complete len:200 (-),score=38.04 TRINITY_DN66936_c8_g15_i1:77-676(-)
MLAGPSKPEKTGVRGDSPPLSPHGQQVSADVLKKTACIAAGLAGAYVCGPLCGFAGQYVTGVAIDYIYAYVTEQKIDQDLAGMGEDVQASPEFGRTVKLFTKVLENIEQTAVLQVAAQLLYHAGNKKSNTPLMGVHVAVTMVMLWQARDSEGRVEDEDVPDKMSIRFLKRCLLTTSLHSHFRKRTLPEVYATACKLVVK